MSSLNPTSPLSVDTSASTELDTSSNTDRHTNTAAPAGDSSLEHARQQEETAISLAWALADLGREVFLAEQAKDWDALAQARDCRDDLLLPLLNADSPFMLDAVMADFFALCADREDGQHIADGMTHALEDLSECVLDEDGYISHRLFALPMLLPYFGRDWNNPLTADELAGVTKALKSSRFIADDVSVTWVPNLVPFTNAMDLPEWTVAKVTRILSAGQIAQAAHVLSSNRGPLRKQPSPAQGTSAAPNVDPAMTEPWLLVGVVALTDSEEFPLGAKVVDYLEAEEGDDAVADALEEAGAALQALALQMSDTLGEPVQVTGEIQGWWTDIDAFHHLVRTVDARQQLDGLLMQNALFEREVIAYEHLQVVSEEPIGVLAHLYHKQDRTYLGNIHFMALTSETPADCIEDCLAFLQSNDIDIVPASQLKPTDTSESTQAPTKRTLH